MIRFSFKPGVIYIESQLRWELIRRLPNGKLRFEADNGDFLILTDQEVAIRWLKQQWIVDEESLRSSATAMYLVVPRDLSTYPESVQREAQRRHHYIKWLNPEINAYRPKVWRVMIQSAALQIGDPRPPAPSTVSAWWRTYRYTKSVLSLMPQRGKHSGPRWKASYEAFLDVVGEVYMSRQCLPKLAVVDALRRRTSAMNHALPPEEAIKVPGRSTIYRWLKDLQQDMVDAARFGAEAARVKYRAVLGKIDVGGVLERVEIDHSPLDLIVIDMLTKLPLGRPWLTVAIDVHSRMVMGFYISFNAPSAYAVLQCLRQAILPKDELLARYPDVKGPWPAHGLMDLIAVDNGRDLHSEAVEAAALEMGIEILFCGAKTPWQKGTVERYMRTVAEGLIHRLPGTVFSSVDARGDYPSEEMAVVDMDTLVHVMIKWIVDVYNVTPHRGIGGRPLDRWYEGIRGRIVELPAYPQQLQVMTGIPATRTVFHYGIELDGLHYNSDLLQLIRRRAGSNLKVDLKYYEDSVAEIHVFDPAAKEYIQVPARATQYAEKLPRDVHRLIRENARRRFGEQCNTDQLLEARAEIEEIIQQAIKDKRMGTRKKGAGLLKHDSVAVLGNQDPLEAARRPIREALPKPPDALPSGLDDELPEIGRFGSEGGHEA